jgi:hypothetical protein
MPMERSDEVWRDEGAGAEGMPEEAWEPGASLSHPLPPGAFRVEGVPPRPMEPVGPSLGSVALVIAVLIVGGFAVAGLLGFIRPVTGAVVGLGAQVVGTVAFFLTYYMGNRDE